MTRFRDVCLGVALCAFASYAAIGQEYKIEPLKTAPPAETVPAIRAVLNATGYRVVDGDGKTFAEIWMRSATPASGPPSGPQGAVGFPILSEGEVLGIVRYPGEGRDYRDQAIAQGVYTMRYGLQPVNGDHLGVSVFRDYVLLLQAAKDKDLGKLEQKTLRERSAEAAGSSHPAVLLMVAPPASSAPPALVHDEEKNTWTAVLPLSLAVKGVAAPATLTIGVVIVGAAMN
ncbi:MAG: hypothetical protein KGM43_08125 [Planctomycetota bacterium]|nr:hypothetical protein [Planctomycetota bacterium]